MADKTLKLSQIIGGFGGVLNACDFGPGGRFIAVSGDGRIHLCNYKNPDRYERSELLTADSFSDSINDVRFSPRGTMFASASGDGVATVWDSKTCRKLTSFLQPTREAIRVIRFSPDATLLAGGGDDDRVHVWDMATNSLVRTFSDHEGAVFALDFTPDGDCLVTSDADGSIYLRSVGQASLHSKCLVFIPRAHDLGVLSCDFAPQKEPREGNSMQKVFYLATSGNDDLIKIWTVSVGFAYDITMVRQISSHSGSVMCVRFSPDGSRIVSSGGDNTIRIHDSSTGNIINTLSHHKSYVTCCAFSKSKPLFLASCSNDKTVALWRAQGNNLRTSSGSESIASSDLFLTEDVLPGGTKTVDAFRTLTGHTADVNDIAFLDNMTIVSGGSDSLVNVWEWIDPADGNDAAITGWILRFKYNNKYPIYSLAVRSEVVITTSLDGSIIVWHGNEMKMVARLATKMTGGIRVSDISQDGSYLITAGDDDKAKVWDLMTTEQVISLDSHDATIYLALFLSRDGSLAATGCNDEILTIWRLDWEKKVPFALKKFRNVHDLGIVCGASSVEHLKGDKTLMLSGGKDSIIIVWKFCSRWDNKNDAESDIGGLITRLEGHGGTITCLRFSPDASIFASTSADKTARLWSSSSFSCLRVLGGHRRYVNCCSFSLDGSMLATGSNDKTIRLWTVDSNCSRPSEGHVSICEDGKPYPEKYYCPITQELMSFPVMCSDGFVYEKAAITEWLLTRRSASPMTNLPITDLALVPQSALQQKIKGAIAHLSTA